HQARQRGAGDELHDQEVRPAGGGLGIEGGDDVGVRQLRSGPHLAAEAFDGGGAGGGGAGGGLQRPGPLHNAGFGLVDGPHAALPQQADDAVATVARQRLGGFVSRSLGGREGRIGGGGEVVGRSRRLGGGVAEGVVLAALGGGGVGGAEQADEAVVGGGGGAGLALRAAGDVGLDGGEQVVVQVAEREGAQVLGAGVRFDGGHRRRLRAAAGRVDEYHRSA